MNKQPHLASDSQRSSRRRSSSRAPRSHHNRTRIIQILGIALALSLLINLFVSIALGSYIRKSNLLSGANNSLRQKVTDITGQSAHNEAQIKTLEKDIEELTLNRLPGLIALSYDEVLTIDKQYVKNIVFTRTGKKGTRLYEFKIVLENRNGALQPTLKILLFNRSGVQVGISELGNSTEHGSITRLDRDEVRSHYAVVQLPNDSEPEYFQVTLL